MVTIVDYGVGNLASIQNMLKKIGVSSSITSNENEIGVAEKLILPGVGAFDTCATKLEASGLKNILQQKVIQEKIPVLGICVGMQLLTEKSEEGSLPGLGWIRGKIVRINKDKIPDNYKIPHMGWSEVNFVKESKLLMNLPDEPRFYFVHSYYAELFDNNDQLLNIDYGYTFTVAIEHDNILGVQFHPEKSHKFGMRIFENFVNNY
ncbi:MAG: imidazole glycerol phosphate synthase, glutamine amidotransferase subunit [Chitinophagaceae bacterium]|nr:imidazole glycerol phosphate synthase, glutamine amidotransferase subunit [Chitinophagaceae bacterium]